MHSSRGIDHTHGLETLMFECRMNNLHACLVQPPPGAMNASTPQTKTEHAARHTLPHQCESCCMPLSCCSKAAPVCLCCRNLLLHVTWRIGQHDGLHTSHGTPAHHKQVDQPSEVCRLTEQICQNLHNLFLHLPPACQ